MHSSTLPLSQIEGFCDGLHPLDSTVDPMEWIAPDSKRPEMTDPKIAKPPVAYTAMLIRRPVAEVFEALVDPAITSQFWFTEATA